MLRKDKILFLVRSYNEGDYLIKTIKMILESWFNKILVVDDWSTDWTYENICNFDNIYYIRHPFNRWWWATLETWFEFVRRYKNDLQIDYVVTFDADGQHDIKDVYKFIDIFEKDNELEVVIWSRFLSNTVENIPLHRKIVLFLWKLFTFFLSNIKISDPHNGYRMFKVSVLDKIYLTMDWFEYASELIEIIARNNIKFTEVPVNIIYTAYSLSKWQKSSNAINIALKMIRKKFLK